jgi:hypothetical protein
MCPDSGNRGEVQAGSIKITVRLFRCLKTAGRWISGHSKTLMNYLRENLPCWLIVINYRQIFLLL